ncbi:phage holin family protein [Streptococcus mitis]|jgi:toxin secretion/phage lysis holin|uniref:phage holin family protein n=1 Tax=Streptococcus mitis TaxID=28037 RepID=UPI00200083F0|nr:phage holin family protein [Streptococcus mitis]DAN90269.1 MAG TPA: holin [Bacteriophage sp.]DAT21177.1 MAG TPA: holin [Caudoviricetes sp.]DAT96750.1 MAG TPA: holin [Caudoviricetes sp.]DAX18913.1 MAG TPA: holin [Bacteriophage sp.]
MHIEFFNFFRSLIQTEDGLVLYALALIVSMEIIDFVTGTIAAIVNPDIEYKSKIGINGLLRKILGVLLLMILIPMSVLLPEKTGFAFLYSIYLGYIAFTFQSLVENYRKLKGNVILFQPILKAFQRLLENDDDKNKGE